MSKTMNYPARLKRLQKVLADNQCSCFLLENPTDIYYLTGLQVSTGKVIVHGEGAVVIVDNRYFEQCKKCSPYPVYLADQSPLPNILQELAVGGALGFDSLQTSYKDYMALKHMFSDVSLLPLENPVRKLRMIKDAEEVLLLKAAAELCCEGYDFLLTQLKEGVVEEELAQELEVFWKRKKGRNVSFEPIIAFGPNASMPHYRAGSRSLKKGDPVLIDIGVNLQHYHSDMTRTVFFGEPAQEIKNVYNIVLKAQLAALALCRPGMTIGELDQIARTYISSNGYGEYFTHGLGHGVGLEIHEEPSVRNKVPYKDMVLQPGMVITIEPGIYLPGNAGVRIEDTVVITSTGHEIITERPKKLLIVAAEMESR